jgi:hypothetical protein
MLNFHIHSLSFGLGRASLLIRERQGGPILAGVTEKELRRGWGVSVGNKTLAAPGLVFVGGTNFNESFGLNRSL